MCENNGRFRVVLQPGKDEWRYHHRLRILFPEPEIPDMPKLQIMRWFLDCMGNRSLPSLLPRCVCVCVRVCSSYLSCLCEHFRL